MVKRRGVLAENQGRCIYTGRDATSADHVPPKSFLVPPLPANLLTVPSCGQFNSDAARDEQYFLMVLSHIGHHPALARRIIEGGDVDRALARSPALDERLVSELNVTPDGRPYIDIDQPRVNFVLEKMAAGLFFRKFGKAPGIDRFQSIALYSLEDPPDLVSELSWTFQHTEDLTVIQWSIFAYGFCNSTRVNDATFCNINFYNSVFALIACPYEN